MNAFDAYKMYLALKQHFGQKGYDYVKYRGKVNATESSFQVRRDKYQFHKLSKHEDLERFLVANFIAADVKWVGDLLDENAEETYKKWLKYQQSITYNFTNEINKLLTNFEDNLIVKDGQHPSLLKQYRRGDVSIETILIIDDIVNFFPYWDKSIEDNVLWPSVKMKMLKYKPFLSFDSGKCKKILEDHFDL